MYKKWCPFLVPSDTARDYLLRNEVVTAHNIIICRETPKGRGYALFRDFIEFRDYFLTSKLKTFYEVIRVQPQKPYFDIDLTTADMSLEKALIFVKKAVANLREFLLELSKKEFCIQVYSSHSTEKISFHIVVEGVYLGNHKQMRIFFEKFMERLPIEIASIFDRRIYGNVIRQFRTLYSEKLNSNRTKIPEFELFLKSNGETGWFFDRYSDKQTLLFLFKGSLITCVSGCDFIQFPDEQLERTRGELGEGVLELTDGEIEEALNMFVAKSGKKAPFRLLNYINSDEMMTIISLKRLSASFCPVCERVHENENPFLIFWGAEKHVALDCRRSDDGERYYIGSLSSEKEEEEEEEKNVKYVLKPKFVNPLFEWSRKEIDSGLPIVT